MALDDWLDESVAVLLAEFLDKDVDVFEETPVRSEVGSVPVVVAPCDAVSLFVVVLSSSSSSSSSSLCSSVCSCCPQSPTLSRSSDITTGSGLSTFRSICSLEML